MTERDKTLEDFDEVLRWFAENNFEATIIGGMAVGAFSPEVDSPLMSADLDLLTTEEEQRKILKRAESTAGVVVVKRPKPRSLGVLVLHWGELEVDVLVRSTGLSSTEEAMARAWRDIAPLPVADPVDLLGIKLTIGREKDEPHIEILRDICQALALTLFADREGRDAFELLDRWRQKEGWARFPGDVFSELRCGVGEDVTKVRYLLRHAPNREAARALVRAASAAQHELEATLSRLFPL